MTQARIDVAVGILTRKDGAVLLAQRPEGKPYAGWWEFPGGKLEAGESIIQALGRELEEELGVQVAQAHVWLTLQHDYPHALVRLHFCKITEWIGLPHGREGQQFAWSMPGHCELEPVLPATIPVLKWLELPNEYAISNAGELGVEVFLHRLEKRLAGGLRLLQLREPKLRNEAFATLFPAALERVRHYGGRMLINSIHPQTYWNNADGVHLRSEHLMGLQAKPDLPWVAASCHTKLEWQQASEHKLDFIVMGPVLPTHSHPTGPLLGWEGLRTMLQGCPIPAYALGGLSMDAIGQATSCGAQGVALMRGAWPS